MQANVTPPRRTDRHLPPEALDDLRGVLDGFDRLAALTANVPAGLLQQMATLRRRLDEDPGALWWTDLAQAQLSLTQLLDEAGLRAADAAWRRRMSEVAGASRFEAYLKSAIDPDATTTTAAMLRADIAECVASVYYFYAAYGLSARSRSEVGKSTLRVAGALLALEGAIALLLSWHSAPGVPVLMPGQADVQLVLEYLIATSSVAILGAVVNVQRRLQDPTVDVDPFYRYIQTRGDRFSVAVISPLYGAVFGAVIYGLLAANIVGGKLISFTNGGYPASSTDVAVLLVFGFIAGFAEQLVPDALTRIAAQTISTVTGGGQPGPDGTIPPKANGGEGAGAADAAKAALARAADEAKAAAAKTADAARDVAEKTAAVADKADAAGAGEPAAEDTNPKPPEPGTAAPAGP